MTHQYSLAHLTVLKCPPPEMVYLAQRAGYDFISPRIIPIGSADEPRYPMAEDKVLLRQTKAALAATGLKVNDIELARIVDGLDPKSYLPAFEVAAELGAPHVLGSAWTSDRNFIVECYAALCDLAKPLGLTVDFEFPSFSGVTNLRDALAILRAADRDNCGIMVDTLYMAYSRVAVEELDDIPRRWFHFAHLCDAPAGVPPTREGMIHVARDARLYAGEGAIDIAAILNRMPEIPYSMELPNDERVAELGYEEHARRCVQAAKRYFALHPRTEEALLSA
jgi:sugar phosphate isomerase/epimerase